ncbi:MAG: hypothetical protein H7321_10320, partial [Bacteroidia bacterium]|nr:hypothetical protein [Bacteroidia bacterium]
YSERKKFAVYTRYRREQKMQDLSVSPGSVKVQESICRRTFRVHLESKISDVISIHSRVESSLYSGNNKSSKGILLFQDFVYSGFKKTTVTCRLSYFSTDDYDSRIYAYESDVMYSFSVPAFQNEGTRFYVLLKYKVSKRLDLWAKVAQTSYFNIETISSGNDLINGSKVTDIKLQARFIF